MSLQHFYLHDQVLADEGALLVVEALRDAHHRDRIVESGSTTRSAPS